MPQMPWFRSVNSVSIAKNTTSQFIGRVVSSLSTVILTIFIARLYGSQGYGEFVKITTYVSFFYLLADFGFNAIYIQRSTLSSTSETLLDPEWNMLLIVRILASALLTVIALLLITIIPHSLSQGYTDVVHLGIILLIPTIVFQSLITTINGLFQKLLRYEWAAVSVILGSVTSVCMIALLVKYQSTSLVLFSTLPLILGSAVTTLVSIIFVRQRTCTIRVEKNLQAYVSFIVATVPLGLTLLFNVIYFHIDSIVMTFSRPTSEVGIYGLAYKVFELLLVFPTFFMNATYPMLVTSLRDVHNGRSTIQFVGLIKKSAVILFVSALVFCVMTWFVAPYISFIKKDFFQSILALRILLCGVPFFFLSSLSMWVLISLKKQWTLAIIYGVSMICNIVLNILLVPTFGYIAAAWITVGSEAVVLLASGAVMLQQIGKLYPRD